MFYSDYYKPSGVTWIGPCLLVEQRERGGIMVRPSMNNKHAVTDVRSKSRKYSQWASVNVRVKLILDINIQRITFKVEARGPKLVLDCMPTTYTPYQCN